MPTGVINSPPFTYVQTCPTLHSNLYSHLSLFIFLLNTYHHIVYYIFIVYIFIIYIRDILHNKELVFLINCLVSRKCLIYDKEKKSLEWMNKSSWSSWGYSWENSMLIWNNLALAKLFMVPKGKRWWRAFDQLAPKGESSWSLKHWEYDFWKYLWHYLYLLYCHY